MKGEKDNPYVSTTTCEAHREGMTNEIRAVRQQIRDLDTLFQEKIKGIKISIVVGVTASTTIIVLIQFFLSVKG